MTLRKVSVEWLEVEADQAGQRLDKFLQQYLSNVPKGLVFRLIRQGEVRINSKRAAHDYRLISGDRIRIPPVHQQPAAPPSAQILRPLPKSLHARMVYEDEGLLVLDKPAGVAVHGGSGIRLGVIEQLRLDRPTARFLELVHRLDRETSGLLMVAKKRQVLVALHDLLRQQGMSKHYLALVQGRIPWDERRVSLALHKYLTPEGERRVVVNVEGKPSETHFTVRERMADMSLVEARLLTGRTHQIRVHLSHLGFPIAGDDKYGDFAWNHVLARQGLKRMFLHAARLSFLHPLDQRRLTFEAPLPADLAGFIAALRGSREE